MVYYYKLYSLNKLIKSVYLSLVYLVFYLCLLSIISHFISYRCALIVKLFVSIVLLFLVLHSIVKYSKGLTDRTKCVKVLTLFFQFREQLLLLCPGTAQANLTVERQRKGCTEGGCHNGLPEERGKGGEAEGRRHSGAL